MFIIIDPGFANHAFPAKLDNHGSAKLVALAELM